MRYHYLEGYQKHDYRHIFSNIFYTINVTFIALITWDLFFNYGRNFINIMIYMTDMIVIQ